MLPKNWIPDWFDDWNAQHPTKNLLKPAILVGVGGTAVFAVAMFAAWGNPLPNDSLQTGPRGTGMSVTKFTADLNTPDPTIAGYLDRGDITEDDIAAVSEATLENVPPALQGIAPEDFAELVVAMRSWTGIPDLLEDPDSYQTQVSHSMIAMVQNINEGWAGHVYANGEVGVTCYTCHRGQPVPSEVWFRIAPVNESVAGWSANQNRVTVQSQFTSLPSDALEKYLLEYEPINVHSLEAHVSEDPSDPGVATWQNTERTYSLMNYFSNSLGRNCVFCHNSRAFYDPGQVTPQWATASLGIVMVQEINNDWLVPLTDVLPDHRLGPIYADVPKVACKTCHQGYQQPLQGMNVIGDFPELANIGPLVDE